MRDLLLTHAYFLARDPHEHELMRPFPPLGIQALVAWTRQAGFDVQWWDATFAEGPAAFDAVLDGADPRVVGFYGHTVTRPAARELVARCVGRRVIAGGPDPIQYLDEYFDMGVEVVVVGEGELTVQALLEHLRANGWRWDRERLREIDGIAFRVGAEVVRTRPRAHIRPLDRLPWPHRDRRDLDAYFDAWRRRHGETAMSLYTSRGCPFHCTWCSKQVYGDTYRRRDPDRVIDEVVHLRETYAPDQLWFVDDLFTLNRTWVHRFCARMVERGAVTPFYGIARPDTLDAAMAEALKKAGCTRLYLSAESGAQHVLDAMRKDTTVEDIENAGRVLREAGIELGIFVMLGYPGEERADVHATRAMIRRLDPEVTLLSLAHPMKGTTFHDAVAERITGAAGGRLTFEMRHGPRFYDAAQRLIWAEQGARRALRERRPREFVRNAARWPVWRAAVEWLP